MKRAFDLVMAAILLVLLAPVILAVAMAIRLKMGSPVFFRQVRPGRDGKPFTMVKFRTMTAPAPGEDASASDARRLTPLGQFLRRSSLDELPEFLSVLRGDMSLVGPRPLLMHYLPLYSARQARRHEVRPGITGWAQVNGRNALSWEEKFDLDVWYVDHRSLALDLKILGLTLLKVLRRDGIANDGHATMPPFRGTHSSGEIP